MITYLLANDFRPGIAPDLRPTNPRCSLNYIPRLVSSSIPPHTQAYALSSLHEMTLSSAPSNPYVYTLFLTTPSLRRCVLRLCGAVTSRTDVCCESWRTRVKAEGHCVSMPVAIMHGDIVSDKGGSWPSSVTCYTKRPLLGMKRYLYCEHWSTV